MALSRITLALQGGGAHGAFAWGTLDRLLEEKTLRIDAITASSGGAMNAVVLADALARGGPEAARRALRTFWRKISIAAGMLPFRATVVDRMLGSVGLDISPSSIALDYLTRLFSPSQFNLFDFNPLRGILEEMVDFEALRTQKNIALFINATEVRTSTGRIFTGGEISLDAVLASACLPFLFKAVEIDGVAYWDGGYSGNPALTPLLNRGAQDVLLIKSIAARADDVPAKAPDILDRATEISFSNALAQQIAALELHNRYHPQSEVRLHTIEADDLLSSLGRASKLNADWDFLLYLHDLGAQAAADWLEAENEREKKTA